MSCHAGVEENRPSKLYDVIEIAVGVAEGKEKLAPSLIADFLLKFLKDLAFLKEREDDEQYEEPPEKVQCIDPQGIEKCEVCEDLSVLCFDCLVSMTS